MPEPAAPTLPSPTQTSELPSLLEQLAGRVDLSDAPVIEPKTLPPIVEKEEEKKPEPKEPQEEPKKKTEKEEADEEAEWKKSSEIIAEKIWGKKKPKEEKKESEPKEEEKAQEVKEEEKPKKRPARRAVQEVDTEAIAAAASEAATRAATQTLAKLSGERKQTAPEPKPEDKLSAAEAKQLSVYKELESLYPDKYKNLSTRYVKSLSDIQAYIKDWAKENPGKTFNPDDEEHDSFFKRIEPDVDEDDYIDAKAAMIAREHTRKAVEPVTEKLKQFEQDRARAVLEPFIREKQLEAVHNLLENFDPEIIPQIRKPGGFAELQEKDPITASILDKATRVLADSTAEIIRLHDPAAGIEYSDKNPLHREIADFVLEQERRISKLPAADRLRDGKMFISRLQFQGLPTEDKSRYWFLNQDDLIYMLSQKYGISAKKVRDEQLEKFNQTAEKLGFKKADASGASGPKLAAKPPEAPKPKEKPTSPEAVSKTSVKTGTETAVKEAADTGHAIVAKLFPHLKSS